MTEHLDINKNHPCFSPAAAHQHARIHLPVAMHCNISCNYCNRKYDCLNESRPGVTSEIITPWQGLERYQYYKERLTNLSVVGIAGPGDALADWDLSSQTIGLIRDYDPEVLLCLSTNGLKLPQLATSIVELGVSHVTVTVNTIDPQIGARIYRYVNYRGQKYTGIEGASLLLGNQLAGIRYLTRHGIMVKVNTVMIPGINDQGIRDVVHTMKDLGVFMTNIMPLIPVEGSVFAGLPATPTDALTSMRKLCQTEMRQMFHCQQCRADAVGLLQDHSCARKIEQQAV
ncbi:MAG: nitrogenase cofactor biosynthesis protein NifB [Syntrophomonadaceae bacterium]|nr:nitrogenase cofactor biosynthesis protein NifB [Syntrophomonadaceae bacterium]